NLVLDSVHYYTKQYARAYLRILNMKDSAGGCLIAVDSFNNTSTGCFTYAGAGKDILPPLFAQDPIALPRGTMSGIVTETRAWDRGIQSVQFLPSSTNSTSTAAVFIDRWHAGLSVTVTNALLDATMIVAATDSAGHIAYDTAKFLANAPPKALNPFGDSTL